MKLSRFESEFVQSQTILRDLDLLLEAHKQLSLALLEPPEEPSKGKSEHDNSTPSTLDSAELSNELSTVQLEISRLESLNSSVHLISTCSIPSVASSEPFLAALRLLISTDPVRYSSSISRAGLLIEKCWDNALVAMERVLEKDLFSLEDYLDDRVYKELRDRVLKPILSPFTLINPLFTNFKSILEHFIASYSRLRVNSVTYILDHRLNNQFESSKEDDQVLHLIERTRLLMVVENREFNSLFASLQEVECKKAQLNKILETIGNLLYQRIEPLCRSLSSFQRAKIAGFIHPLMNSILKIGSNDPFGLFLRLLSQKHFPEIEIKEKKEFEAEAKEFVKQEHWFNI